MKHRILIYGGLGNVASERIIPSLDSLQNKFSIEYATVDLQDKGPKTPYKYGNELIQDYNIAILATLNNTRASRAIRALDSGLC